MMVIYVNYVPGGFLGALSGGLGPGRVSERNRTNRLSLALVRDPKPRPNLTTQNQTVKAQFKLDSS